MVSSKSDAYKESYDKGRSGIILLPKYEHHSNGSSHIMRSVSRSSFPSDNISKCHKIVPSESKRIKQSIDHGIRTISCRSDDKDCIQSHSIYRSNVKPFVNTKYFKKDIRKGLASHHANKDHRSLTSILGSEKSDQNEIVHHKSLISIGHNEVVLRSCQWIRGDKGSMNVIDGDLYFTERDLLFYKKGHRGLIDIPSRQFRIKRMNILEIDIRGDEMVIIVKYKTRREKRYDIKIVNRKKDGEEKYLFDQKGNRAIHYASLIGELKYLKLLLGYKPRELSVMKDDGEDIGEKNEMKTKVLEVLSTILRDRRMRKERIVKDQSTLVEYLMSYYIRYKSVIHIYIPSRFRKNYLHFLLKHSNIHESLIFDLLERFSDERSYSERDREGNTAFLLFGRYCVSPHFERIGEYLIERIHRYCNGKNGDKRMERDPFIDHLNIKNYNRESVLHLALLNRYKSNEMTHFLLAYPIDVSVKDKNGETALYYAIKRDSFKMVLELVERGSHVDVINKRDQSIVDLSVDLFKKNRISKKVVKLVKRLEYTLDLLKRAGLEEHFIQFVSSGYIKRSSLEKLKSEYQSFERDLNIKIGKEQYLRFVKELNLLGLERNRVHDHLNSLFTTSILTGHLSKRGMSYVERSIKKDELESFLAKGYDIKYMKVIGSGATSVVYRGIYDGKDVAIKVFQLQEDDEHTITMCSDMTNVENGIRDCMNEFKILTRIENRCDHIIRFYGTSLEPSLCLLMEYCHHGSLTKVLKRRELRIGWCRSFKWTMGMCHAIHYLHNIKPIPYVHRDVKTDNYLVTKDWKVKLCDFGLTRKRGGDKMKPLKKLTGTLEYIAPEVQKNEMFHPMSDIYGLGICYWEVFQRVMKGMYEKPYESKRDGGRLNPIPIFIAATQGERPIFIEGTPKVIIELYDEMVSGEIEERPTSEMVMDRLKGCIKSYRCNKKKWDDAIRSSR